MAAKKKAHTRKFTPPDTEQCQAEKPNGHSFMTIGGSPGMERCKNKPSCIVIETAPGEDGKKGSMALCPGCLEQFEKQMPKGYATVIAITETWERVTCDLCARSVRYIHPTGGRRCGACPRPVQ